MSEILTRTVLCDDCDDWTEELKQRGRVVLDCKADASQPGMCVIRYQHADTAAAAAAPASPAAGAAAPPGGIAFMSHEAMASLAMPTASSAAKAIVNLFETGEVLGNYGAVTVLDGDTGHLTYGRSQTTLGSGNLALLVASYCKQAGARFGERLQPWLSKLKKRDVKLDADLKLHNVLRACADDPVMRDVQDRFFDETYWEPAVRAAAKQGITLPLGVAIVYDSVVHGSWGAMRDRTDVGGKLKPSEEKVWLTRYVATRREWLAMHSNPLLRKTVYRMDAFKRLIDQGFWGLQLPLVVRDKEISLATLSGLPGGCFDGPQPGTRNLAVQSPFLRGLDVRLVQLGLSDLGCDVRADGVFGSTSANLIRKFQFDNNLPQTGVADAALVARLVAA